jgi:predicted RNase H-like HicB family nuclease
MNHYLVIYEQAEDGAWGAHSPDVEGVFALGETREEVEAGMAEALSAHLSHLRESGQPIPKPPKPVALRRRRMSPDTRLQLSRSVGNSAQLSGCKLRRVKPKSPANPQLLIRRSQGRILPGRCKECWLLKCPKARVERDWLVARWVAVERAHHRRMSVLEPAAHRRPDARSA